MKKGISLITLVITIIVVMILAGAVILTLANNNPIENANEAVFKSNIEEYKSELNLWGLSNYAKSIANFDINKVYADETVARYGEDGAIPDVENITDIITSIKNSDVKKFIITEGKLVYIGKDNADEKKWAIESGILVQTSIILEDTVIDYTVSSDKIIGTINIQNTESEIDFNSSMYIISEESTAYEENDPIWNTEVAKHITSIEQNINETINESGDYYIHVLLVSTDGARRVNISEKISITVSPKVVQISSGSDHAVALLDDGRVVVWGYNEYGQLGDGTINNSFVPKLVHELIDVKQISAGNRHTVAIMNDGTTKVWGYNDMGQLGDNSNNNSLIPKELTGIINLRQISAGEYHTVAIMSDKTLKAWGLNGRGQLGNNTSTNTNYPITVSGVNDVKQVVAGRECTFALKEDGTVMAWGSNTNGQLGDGTLTQRKTPVAISALTNVAQIVTGGAHTVALLNDGTLKVSGYNEYGQLGIGSNSDIRIPAPVVLLSKKVKQVTAGYAYTVALMEDGTVMSWGRNNLGQLGIGNTTNSNVPVQIPGLVGVKQISAYSSTTIALMEDGTIKAWGSNITGQLGDGTTENSLIPKDVILLTD